MKNKPSENPSQSIPPSTTSLTSEEVASLGRSGEPISEQEYRKFVADLAALPEECISRINPHTINLLHATLGLASEAGELLDEVKKHIFYGAPLNYDAIHKEQGDMEWYAQLLRNTLGPPRDTVINANVAKLKKRHPNGFSTESALAKADAVEDKPEEKSFLDQKSPVFENGRVLSFSENGRTKYRALVCDTAEKLANIPLDMLEKCNFHVIVVGPDVIKNTTTIAVNAEDMHIYARTLDERKNDASKSLEEANKELDAISSAMRKEQAENDLEKFRSQSLPPR